MSVRDGIPEDIWQTASGIATRQPEVGALFSENYIRPVALAILNERDRCAELGVSKMNDLDDAVEDASDQLRHILDDAGIALPYDITKTIEALIAAKISKALAEYSNLIQDATGVRP